MLYSYRHQLWRYRLWLAATLLLVGAFSLRSLGEFSSINTLHLFWWGVGVMGAGFVLSWSLQIVPACWFWGVAIATRLLLLNMTPGDDIWRYLWEGLIQNQGFSPYHFAPDAPVLEPYRTEWWGQINHLDVSAIYPPLTQLGFRLLAAIAPTVITFKLAFVAADLLVCELLSQISGKPRATLYAWNPAVIYTFAGGGHYDSWFILPLVWAWRLAEKNWAPDQGRRSSGLTEAGIALLVGLSIAIKWVSLPILGWLVWRSLHRPKFHWSNLLWGGSTLLYGLMPILLSPLPFCRGGTCPLIPTESTFVAYGRSAELIPHLVAQWWPLSLQANWIYGFPLGLFVLWLLLRAISFLQFVQWYFFALLLITPIIHFWYFVWLLPFAVPSQNWGARFVSLSAFVYFVLPLRVPDWRLTPEERWFLWLPFVLGWLWTVWQTYPRFPQKYWRPYSSQSGSSTD